jgi:hypothetical protein
MGSVGDAYDNAMCESFFATLECELLDRRRFKTQGPIIILPLHRHDPYGRVTWQSTSDGTS